MRPGALAAVAALASASGCGPLSDRPLPPAKVAARIVTTERGARGGRLVAVDEDGTRLADITRVEGEIVLDTHPAFSPDGSHLVFASTRGRPLSETSLWVVRAESGSAPRRLTQGRAVDRDPAWTPDGRGIVYASSAGGSFDLWLQPIEWREGEPLAGGAPRQLTDAATHELSPAVAPHGGAIAYAALDRESGKSTLWVLDKPGAAPRQLTEGPASFTPAWSADGRELVFAGPVKGRDDTDLYAVAASGGEPRRVCDEPLSDETGPIFSGDGKLLFATSLYRSVADGSPVLASLVVINLSEQPARLRALHDPVAVDTRLGAAVAPRAALDRARLRKNRPYEEALRRAMRQQMQQRDEQGPSQP